MLQTLQLAPIQYYKSSMKHTNPKVTRSKLLRLYWQRLILGQSKPTTDYDFADFIKAIYLLVTIAYLITRQIGVIQFIKLFGWKELVANEAKKT